MEATAAVTASDGEGWLLFQGASSLPPRGDNSCRGVDVTETTTAAAPTEGW